MNKINNVAQSLPVSLESCCRNCPSWNQRAPDHPEQGGECRLNPPVVFQVMANTLQGQQMAFTAAWPVTSESAWCSQHPDREEWPKDSVA